MFTFQVVTAVVADKESNNQGWRTKYRGSILGHSIVNRNRKKVEAHNPYFKKRTDALGVLGLSCLQKVIAAHMILAYGIPTDLTEEYLRIGETTAIESRGAFVKAIVEVFGDWYLRAPNEVNICRLLSIGELRGFPGMLGKAVASQDLWIWHAFFGMLGSINDIDVLDRSPIFAVLAEGRTAPVNYIVNRYEYTMGYYLADEIYPNWSIFVKTIPRPLGAKRNYFASKQESARKDVERAFEVFQSRFAIVRGPVRYWDKETDRATSSQLQEDLIEHLWKQYGNE
eukprot:XP_024437198.1 uncharacterized protein LOC112323394 [Populus trichocarpa]